MNFRLASAPPAARLLAASLICLALGCAIVALAVQTPWIGVTLAARGDGVTVIATENPKLNPQLEGRRLIAVDGVQILPSDLLEDPDYLADNAQVAAFMSRQTRLAQSLRSPAVTLTLADDHRILKTLILGPAARPIETLPPRFWAQLGFALGSAMIAAWVWALRPREPETRLFALTGGAMLASAGAAAIYSTRELGLDGDLFSRLSAINHAGAAVFGYAMASLLLIYPKRLIDPRLIAIVSPAPLAWLSADLLRLFPSPMAGSGALLIVHAGVITLAVALQWRATRDDPVGRAALRWLGLSVGIVTLGVLGAAMAPLVMGRAPLVEQAVGFGGFFLVYVGLAVGLKRSRVFKLDDWAFRIAFYTAAAVLLLVVDAGLILLLGTRPDLSLGMAILMVAALYLPLRGRLWSRLVARRRITDEVLFDHIVDINLAVHPADRDARWRALLLRLFEPLHIQISPAPHLEPKILEDGMTLAMPASGTSPSLLLYGPWGGRALFGPAHLSLARKAANMIARAEARRDDYQRGAAEERTRIAQDLHDDVGARLLTSLHMPDLADTRRVIRDAIIDVRMLASELGGEQRALGDLLADLRHETLDRFRTAGVAIDWPPPQDDAIHIMDFASYKALRSSVRELVSNVIRHAQARHVSVRIDDEGQRLRIEITDDGLGGAECSRRSGMGLAGISRRMTAIGGTFELPRRDRGTQAVLCLTLARPFASLRAGAPDGAVP